jgi:fucose 4-O-acetylase-like acetyltransferase
MNSFLLSPAPALAAPAAPLVLAPTRSLGQRVGLAFRQLHHSSPVLAWAGWLHVGLALLAAALLFFDPRLLTGAPVWVKPLKFAVADGLFVWSLGWLLAGLPAAARPAVSYIGRGVALSIIIETVIIFIQAARGQTSHYNVSSVANALLFGTMGVFILVNTVLSVWAAYLVWHSRYWGRWWAAT